MASTISGIHLLDPAVIDEPYGFYEDLRAGAPVWEVPGTGIGGLLRSAPKRIR
jgi:hypothetical protein